jgi:uncharacterized Tic20 family protein
METLDQENIIPTSDEKNIALLCHIGTFFGGFILPLIVYLIKKDESKFVAEHAKESLNFQISMFIYLMASFVLAFIFIGFIMMFALGVLALITVILATIAASKGEYYKYPLCIRLIK